MKNNPTVLIALFILFAAFLSAQSQVFTGFAVTDCDDSDNANLYEKGTTSAGGDTLIDYCDGDALIEYFCESKDLRVKVFQCDKGCDRGACLKTAGKGGKSAKRSLKLGSVSNQIEIGEFVGDVKETLSEFDTDALKSGKVYTKSGASDFNQYLRFKTNDGVLDGRILFAENEDDEIGDFLVFEDKNFTFEYELQFESGLTSEIDSKSLPDLEDESVFILDREYMIDSAELSGTRVTLKLVSGDAPSRIDEGESKKYQLENGVLNIEVLNIDDSNKRVTLLVNGKTKKLIKGEVAIVEDVVIGIRDVFVNEVGEGSDFIFLYLGAERVEFKDDDYSDNDFDQTIKVNGDSISSGYTKIKGVKSGDDFEILSLKYRMKPRAKSGSTVYVPPKKGLKEFLRDPEAMLANWDIVYGGLSSQDEKVMVRVDPRGGDQYDLEFQNIKGEQYDVPFVVNKGGNLATGDDDNTLFFVEGLNTTDFVVARNDYLVLTNRNNKNGVTNIARYSSIDTSSKVVDFDELIEGSKKLSYSGTEGVDAVGDLIISGHNYRVYIGGAPDYKLAVDLNSDGDVASDETNVVVKGGGLFDLGTNQTPNNSFNFTLTTESSQFDSSSSDEVINIEILNTGSGVDLTIPTQSGVTIETASGNDLALSNYGVFMKKDDDDPDELKIEYPLSQAVGDLELVFFETITKSIEVIPPPPVVQTPKPLPTPPKVEPPVQQPAPTPEPPIIIKESWLKRLWNAIMHVIVG